ncbi:MAG: helix-turn-helix domain-containing protein [Bacillaceae bacterium]|nr:helix-turn-helix domain-containing protein [Bacillaceae bacterium]
MNKQKIEKEHKKEFGRLIRAIRLERGMSIEEFAHELGIGRTTVDRLENGRNTPNYYTLSRLLLKGNIDINSLLVKASTNTGYKDKIMKEKDTE